MTKYLPLLIIPVVLTAQWLYYGDFLPNTVALKSGGENGFEYFMTFLFKEFFYFPIFIGAVWYCRKDYFGLLLILSWCAYIIFISGEDSFDFNRFFIPIIPIIIIYFSRFAEEEFKRKKIIRGKK